jgi:hypothetical protein
MRDEEQIRLTLALYSRFNDYKDEEAPCTSNPLQVRIVHCTPRERMHE